MYCAKCGNEIREGAAFCPSCGSPVTSAPGGQQPQAQQASGAPQTPQAQQAPGTPQVPGASQVPQQVPQQVPGDPQSRPGQIPPQTPAPKKRRGLIIGIVAGVAAIAAIAAVVVFVVLPKVMPRGIWLVTKETSEQKDITAGKTSTTLAIKNISKSGVLVSETYEDSSSDLPYKSETSYTTNEQGFCESSSLKYSFSNLSDDETEQSNKFDWTFGNDGMPSELNVVDNDNNSTRYAYEYDEKGNIRKRSFSNNNSKPYSYSAEFDEQGNLTHLVVEEDGKTYEATYEYERDSSGQTTGCTFNRLEKSTGKKVMEGTGAFERDENGNIVKEQVKQTSYDLENNGKRTDVEATYNYEYTYVENPLPWVAKLAYLYTVPNAIAY